MNGFILGDAVVATVNNNMDVISGGAVAVKGNTIIDIGKTDSIRSKYPDLKYIDTQRSLVMPGMINTHTHMPMSLVRGLAEDLALHEWLWKTYDFKMKFIPRSMFKYGVKLSLLELIKNGTTTICDMSFHQYMIAEIARDFKVRAVLCDTMMETYFTEQTFKEIDTFLTTDYGALITKALALHAPYTCDLKQFHWLKEMIEKYPEMLYSIHLVEAKNENKNFKKRFGITPVALLKKLKLLSERLLAIHCVWLSDKEIDLFKKHNVKVSYCPESNMKLGSGIAPVNKMLNKGLTVSIGTDGAASNNDLDLFSEIDSGAKLQKVWNTDPTKPTAKQMVRMATIEGAKALGLDKITGSLEKNKRADIIVLDLQQIRLKPVYDIHSHIVYSVNGRDVNDVIVDGNFIVRNKKVLVEDEKALLAELNTFNKDVNIKLMNLYKQQQTKEN